jgi:hypothetical protein
MLSSSPNSKAVAKQLEPFVCGGAAATFASIVIHPIDLAKVCILGFLFGYLLYVDCVGNAFLQSPALTVAMISNSFHLVLFRFGCNCTDN